jgi:hypothetical protein
MQSVLHHLRRQGAPITQRNHQVTIAPSARHDVSIGQDNTWNAVVVD